MPEPARGGLPAKVYFRIGEVADLVGVAPHVLRYWEREFRSIRPTKSGKGQRVYSRRDVENLIRVRQLLYSEGFTIAGAKRKLQQGAVEEEEPADGAEPAELPASAPSQHATRPEVDVQNVLSSTTRKHLLAIRDDIEAFLAASAVVAGARDCEEASASGASSRGATVATGEVTMSEERPSEIVR
ncbi:MAG: MerR family transcriptional regulator [Myxococcota bacterium]|nr:MerR family transcriptional regulator [Myxococcota bacterium]